MALDHNVLDIIACPCCKGRLIYDASLNELMCPADKLAFPIDNDIPVLLENRARHLTHDELPSKYK